jgi:VIT1/CCC1 family predicted Fe2+/Mn2+ transporter
MSTTATPPDHPADAQYEPHVGATRQYMRDIILGVNDGLVSMFLLVVGVVGGGLTSRQVLLAALAGAVAGAVSMAAGEYIATKSQEEVFDREEALERKHLRYHRQAEKQEIRDMFGEMGLPAADVEHIVTSLDRDDEAFLKVMMALEFGVVAEERRAPLTAATYSGLLFIAGSLPSTLPFAFCTSPYFGLYIAASIASVALLTVGALKTLITHGSAIRSATENLLIAAAGAGLSWLIGSLVGTYAL